MDQAAKLKNSRFPIAGIIKRFNGLARFSNGKPRSEPSLEDVMSDPIILQLMAADKLNENDVRGVIVRAQNHFNAA